MKNARWPMTLAFLAAGVFLLAFLFVAIFGGARIGFLYGGVAGFSTLHNVAQWAGIIAAAGFFVAAAIVAVAVSVRPASWGAKILAVLPAVLLLFLLGGVATYLLWIGAVGNLAVVPVLGPVTFASAWPALGAVLAVPAVVIAAASGLAPAARRMAATALGFTSLAAAVAAIATIGTLVIVTNNQPRVGNFGPRPQAAQAQQGSANGGRAGAGSAGQGRNSGGFQGGQPGQFGGEGGFPEGGFPEGAGRFGGEGGPAGAGGVAAARNQFLGGGALMVVSALVTVLGTLVTLAGTRFGELGAAGGAAVAAGHGAGSALLAGVGVILVAFGAIQLVPVSRANPPVQNTVHWDSPQTQELWQRACADCHSNQTQWPWYTTIAPSSWLTAAHVNAGRQAFNISQGSGRRGAGEAVQQVRSGAMPPQDYLLIHPAARLTDQEKQLLMDGLQKSLGR